jgi:DNA-binding transcriptional regulator YiaG
MRPAKLSISGPDVQQVRLRLDLSLAQWAQMLGVDESAAQRWEQLKHAGPRVSSLVRLHSVSQQLMPPQTK